jgi:hypothetical protein
MLVYIKRYLSLFTTCKCVTHAGHHLSSTLQHESLSRVERMEFRGKEREKDEKGDTVEKDEKEKMMGG